MEDLRALVSNGLRRLAATNGGFKASAYRKAAAVVEEARSFVDEAGARQSLHQSLTERMMGHVLEIIAAGPLTGPESAAAELEKVSGLGPATAKRLASQGVTSIADLKERRSEFKLSAAQCIALDFHDDIVQRIPRAEMSKHEVLILDAAASSGTSATVTGSYRRGGESSGDIDVLLVGDLAAFLHELRSTRYVVAALAEGPHKFMGIVRLPGCMVARRLDVLCTPLAEFPYALLHFTGPKEFNVALRKLAMSKGWKLSEKSLVIDGGESFHADSENDVLQALGVQYTPPQDRCGNVSLILAAD